MYKKVNSKHVRIKRFTSSSPELCGYGPIQDAIEQTLAPEQKSPLGHFLCHFRAIQTCERFT